MNQEELTRALREVDDGALVRAAAAGDTATVKSLLSAGANVHYVDDSPLRVAALNGHTETVEALLAGGADLHARSDEALCWAGINGHSETHALLLKAHIQRRNLRPPDLSPN